jgi:hypothetical protein
MSYNELMAVLAEREVMPLGGASEQAVQAAEGMIGRFPAEYRRFLRDFGWIEVDHIEVYGLGESVPSYLNVARMTMLERAEPAVPLPPRHACIMNDGFGNLHCVGVGKDEEQGLSDAVVCWDHKGPLTQDPVELAESFARWLIGLLTE